MRNRDPTEEFREIWQELFGEPLSLDEAAVEAANLVEFYDQLSKTLNRETYDERMLRGG